jgi:hypothetical protein
MEQLSNNALSYLDADITNVATTLTVTDAASFPTSGTFRILINREIMKVTGISGTTLTVVRAQEGTTGVAATKGDMVVAILTKSALLDWAADYASLTSFAAKPTVGLVGRVWYQTDGPYMAIDDGAAWNYRAFSFPLKPPVFSGAWINQGSATLTTTKGYYYLSEPGGSTLNLRIQKVAAPSAPYTITAAFQLLFDKQATAYGGICWRESSSGKLLTWGFDDTDTFVANKYTDASNLSSAVALGPPVKDPRGTGLYWLRLEDDNTDRKLRISLNGQDWTTVFTETRTTFLTPNEVGIFVNSQNSEECSLALYHWEAA